MKTLLIFILLFYTTCCLGQKCSCKANPDLADFIDCTPQLFDNGCKLYWQYNCDSSWLTFENKSHHKNILCSESPELTERIGYSYAAEYNNLFLICNKVISGCCDPPEYLLFDKRTGNEMQTLGRILFYSENRAYPIIISITNSNYNPTAHSKNHYNSLTIRNVNTGKKYTLPLPKDRLYNTLQHTDDFFPELLFQDIEADKATVTLPYRYKVNDTDKQWHNDKIIVKMNKYL